MIQVKQIALGTRQHIRCCFEALSGPMIQLIFVPRPFIFLKTSLPLDDWMGLLVY
jgi:hypothetical protein